MKAAGLSAHQILAPLLLTAGLVSLVSFAFNERVVTRATATLTAWQAVNYGPIPKDSGVRSTVYLAAGNDILEAAVVSGSGPATQMSNVSFYERDPKGMIQRELRSDSAAWANPGWRLAAPRIFDVRTAEAVHSAAPVVVAKGQDLLALRIREIAEEHNVPVFEDVALARSMYKQVSVGSMIPSQFYQAVAELVRIVYSKKAARKATQ